MIKVLLVDDEYYFRQAIKQLVDWNALGFEIIGEANNGVDALKQIPQADLVLLDINIPLKLGLDVLKECIENNYRAKVVIVTVYSEFAYAKTAISLGAIDYILKPVDTDELLRVLNKAKEIFSREQQYLHAAVYNDLLGNDMFQTCCGNFFSTQYAPAQSQPVSFTQRIELLRLLRSRDVQSIRQIFLKILTEKQYTPLNMYILLVELLSVYSEFCNELGLNFLYDELCTTAKNIIIQAASLDEIITWVYEQAIQILDFATKESGSSVKNTQTIEAVREYIQAHYMESDLKLTKIAQHFYLNYQYLSKLFSQQTGTTINAYITQIRLEHAKTILDQGENNLQIVSDLSGYNDINYFSRCFKKKYGVSPAKYLELKRKSNGAE